MVARLIPTEIPAHITPENHPENAPPAVEEKPPAISLGAIVGIGALCSLVGMTVGTAALSTAMQSSDQGEMITLLPMVGTAVAFLGGWVGAFFHLVQSSDPKKAP